MLRRRVACLGVLAAILGGCGAEGDGSSGPLVSSASLPVVGGVPASPDDYPSTVALTDSSGEPFCTGTLVAPKTVVTAAHCLAYSGSDVWIAYGTTDPASLNNNELHEVVKAVAHPDYDSSPVVDADGMGLSNDIGVVVLKEPIAGAKVTPVLPAEEIEAILYPNRDIHIAGYGIYDMPWTGGELYKAVTPHIRHIEWEMLAGKPGKPDTCNGDSGGPAYVLKGCELWLVGATSRAWKKSTEFCGDGGLYTLVPRYIAWLEAESGETVSPKDADAGTAGLPIAICEDAGAADATIDVLPDVDSKCFPATSVCNPLTGYGCELAKGEACTLDDYGDPACAPGPNKVELGGSCDQTSLFCQQGLYCGGAFKCAKLCCADADCGSGGTCKHLATASGTLGTCSPIFGPEPGPEPQPEAGPEPKPEAGPEAGSGGSDAQAEDDAALEDSGQAVVTDPPAAKDDGGCGCRTHDRGGEGGVAGMLAVAAMMAVFGYRRRA